MAYHPDRAVYRRVQKELREAAQSPSASCSALTDSLEHAAPSGIREETQTEVEVSQRSRSLSEKEAAKALRMKRYRDMLKRSTAD